MSFPSLAIPALTLILLASCVTEPEKTFLRSEITKQEDIVGFYADSSIVLHQVKRKVDYYAVGKDTLPESKTVYSMARIFNYLSGQAGDSVQVPDYASMNVRGSVLFYSEGNAILRYDFAERKLMKSGIVLKPDSPVSISGDGEIMYTCEKGVSRIIALKTGALLHSDSDGVGKEQACSGYLLVGKKPLWQMYNSVWGGMIYRTISLSGVGDWVKTNDGFEGYYIVHDVGLVAYYHPEGGPEFKVPEYLDPGGWLTKAFNTFRIHGITNASEVNVDNGMYLTGNKVYGILDSVPVFTPQGRF
jgi:hypothetical protein